MASAFMHSQPSRSRRPHGIKPAQAPAAYSQGQDWGERALQRTWRSVGSLFFGIGLVNAFLPVMPTTVFLLIGLWAYGKGDPRMRERLLAHPKFGPSLRLWVEKKQISRKGKVAAITGIAASASLTAYALGPRPLMWAIVGGMGVLCAYLASRSEPATPAA